MNQHTNNKTKNLKISHWNCSTISNKLILLKKYIQENDFDILSLNETKLVKSKTFVIDGYHIVRKDRNSRGGGVAILVKNNLNFVNITYPEFENSEILSIEIELSNQKFHFISYYLPPNEMFKESILLKINTLKNVIVCGDLNCKSQLWYCNEKNKNGDLLEKALDDTDLCLLNNNKATHKHGNILDLLITSPNIADKLKFFKVHQDDLTSDHYPIFAIFDIPVNNFKSNSTISKRIINWEKYQTLINAKYNANTQTIIGNDTALEIKLMYSNFIYAIKDAYEEASFILNKKRRFKTLPKYLVDIINARKRQIKLIRKFQTDSSLKTQYNHLTKLLREELASYRRFKFLSYCESIKYNKKGSKWYWKKIKIIGKLNDTQNRIKELPTLVDNYKEYKTNNDKAQLFSNKLKSIFKETPNDSFDNQHKQEIDNFLEKNRDKLFISKLNDEKYNKPFSIKELEDALKTCNSGSSAGPDRITNQQLKNLPSESKLTLLNIFNKSWSNRIVIEEWKLARITMIPKKNDDLGNPDNYRPISLTNSIVKLLEKMVKFRLVNYLEDNKILSDYQSGFRKKRQTTDNILFLTQKIYKGFHENQTTCGIIFDIMKAFDKVWHNGLIYKLNELKLPFQIGYWILDFLKDRKFQVKVGDSLSDQIKIETGVPQGSILSPILFTIFINDIIKLNQFPNHKIISLLFADDLFAFVQDKNENRVKLLLQKYLDDLALWFNKWRLNVAPKKCNFMVFNKRKRKTKYVFKIFGEEISRTDETRYLGIQLNSNLNYKQHVEIIRKKCLKTLNVLKCLSNKSWSLNKEGLIMVYKSLIRSNIEYAAPILIVNDSNIRRLHGIQYSALRIILKKPIKTSSKEMHKETNLLTIEERLYKLANNYLVKNEENPLIKQINSSEDVLYNSPIQRILQNKM